MIGFNAEDHRAIEWFFGSNPGYKPALSTSPYVYYESKGKTEKIHINVIHNKREKQKGKSKQA